MNAAPADPARRTGIAAVDDVLDEAIGRGRRHDPVLPRTGGPAGNARLTSWTGLLLLVLIAGELLTLIDVTGLIDWHVGVGIAMVGLALLKTASTGWRILRYYTGSATYRSAGPPPSVLRVLGPLVIASTLGVLGSGIALVAIGPQGSRAPWLDVLGQSVSPITVHQAFFILFAVFAGLHLLARFVPALSLATGRPAPPHPPVGPVSGRGARGAVLLAAVLASAIAVAVVVPTGHGWQDRHRFRDRPGTVQH